MDALFCRVSAGLSPGDGSTGKQGLWYSFCLLPGVTGLPGSLQGKKKKAFCSGKEQLVLCQGQNEGKEHRVWQGGDELSPVRIFFFMHPFHSMAGANLSGGFHDPAKAPALGGIFLVAPVPVLAELIQGKITLQMYFVLGQISPMCWLFAWPETVPGAREGAVSQGLGRQVLPWQN